MPTQSWRNSCEISILKVKIRWFRLFTFYELWISWNFDAFSVENTIQSLQTKLVRDLRDADNNITQIKKMIPPNVLKMTLKELKGLSNFDELATIENKSNVNSTIAEIISKADEGKILLIFISSFAVSLFYRFSSSFPFPFSGSLDM